MASDKPLTLIRSPAAIDELHDIWQWNARYYSASHADSYLRYLTESIADLSSSYARGKVVATRPDLRYIIIRRRSKGHGHVAVYNFDEKEVHLLHIFHTAQDWQKTLVDK